MKNIRIRGGTHRPRSMPKRVYADTKYNTPLVIMMMYLAARGLQHASRKEQTRRGDPVGRAYLTMKRTPGYEAASSGSLPG